jgi:hypothetical protein
VWRDKSRTRGTQSGIRGTRVLHQNEFRSFVDMRYRGHEVSIPGGTMTFSMAPGLRLAPGQLNQVCQHAVLGHGMAVQAVRAKARGVEVC